MVKKMLVFVCERADEGMSDVIGVRGAAVVMRRNGECQLVSREEEFKRKLKCG